MIKERSDHVFVLQKSKSNAFDFHRCYRIKELIKRYLMNRVTYLYVVLQLKRLCFIMQHHCDLIWLWYLRLWCLLLFSIGLVVLVRLFCVLQHCSACRSVWPWGKALGAFTEGCLSENIKVLDDESVFFLIILTAVLWMHSVSACLLLMFSLS